MRSSPTVFVTLLIAFVLTVLPMPDWAIWFRPAWVLMVLIYWAMVAPYQVNVGTAWLAGLVVDLLNGTLLGEHALGFTVIVYFVAKLHLRLRMYSMLQQTMSVFMFILTYQFIVYCIQGFIGAVPSHALYWMSALTSTLLWPWLYVLIRDYHVSDIS